MCICPARATVVADRAHVIKERMDFLESSLISQKKTKGTYLGVISSNMGKKAVEIINSSGSDIIKISTSKNAFCMMYGEYCVDHTGFKGQGMGCSNSNIACKSAFDRAKLVERIRQLIEERRKASSPDKALLEAVISQNLDGVRSALKAGANPNVGYMDIPVIFLAGGEGGEGNIAKELIKAGADVNKVIDYYDNSLDGAGVISLLSYVTYYGRVDFLQTILDAGANPNLAHGSYGVTPAMFAIINPDREKGLEALKILLKNGANPNGKLLKGMDAFMGKEISNYYSLRLPTYMDGMNLVNIAALVNNEDAFNELVKAGGDTKHKSAKGVDSLMFNLAGFNYGNITNPSLSLFKTILKSGVDLNSSFLLQDKTISPVVLTIEYPEMLEELVKVGADVNHPGSISGLEIKSSYPLCVAIGEEEDESIKILEKAGAVLSEEDRKLLGLGAENKKEANKNSLTEDEKEVRTKSLLAKLRSPAELAMIMAGGEGYKDLGDEFTGILGQINEIYGVNNVVRRTPVTYKDWCLSVALPTSKTNWCVDSNGYVGEPTNNDTCDLSYRCIFGERRP